MSKLDFLFLFYFISSLSSLPIHIPLASSLCDSLSLQADELLTSAQQQCKRTADRNRRLIVKSLVPVKLLRGQLPTEALMRRNHCEHYVGIVKAIKEGNLKLFDETIEAHQLIFIRAGVFLLLSKLRLYVVRRVIKRAYVQPGDREALPDHRVLPAEHVEPRVRVPATTACHDRQ